jgi:hypothetical protein
MKGKSLIVALLALMLVPGVRALAAPGSPSLDELRAQIFRQTAERVGDEIRLTFRSPAVARKAGTELALVWSQEIRYPEASYIAPHFSRFDLPAGAYVVIRSPRGDRSWTYSGRGKGNLGATRGFWGIHVPGETALVELYARGPVPADAVVIDSFAHGFPAPEREVITGRSDVGSEAICGVDNSDWAQCYQSSEPTVYNKSRAVLRLLIGGTSACTGWLVGDAGHVLTNQHCIGTSSSALNTDYEVMAEGSCSTNCGSFGACPGTILATSGTLVKVNTPLDYSLILLPTNPTGTYGFFQMRTSGAVVDERIYIPGHPGAFGKKIALNSTHSSDASGKCEVFSLNEPPCSGGPGDTGYFCDTQGGSSGSPVVGYSDHAVVSLHHCAQCPNRGVPIQSVISDLGASLPPNSTVGGPPPPPCLAPGAACTSNGQCCSNSCKGKPGSKTCR